MTDTVERPTFEQELRALINQHSRENGSNTPDFILAEYLAKCLELFDQTVAKREQWYAPTRQVQPWREAPTPSPIEPDYRRTTAGDETTDGTTTVATEPIATNNPPT